MTPGIYNVQAELPGFATSLQRGREFLVGTTVTLDIVLKVASTSETVEVTADAGKIDTTQSQVATVVTPATIDNLPTIGRSFSDLAALSPGVYVSGTSPSGAGSIQIGDSQPYQTGFVVDGTNAENGKNGGQIIRYAQEWINEFSLVSQNADAAFGGASGGVVNAVSRSGTNNIHGRIYGYFQDSSLNSFSWGATLKPPTSQQRYGAMVGGAIKKDKLFYFVGYEGFNSSTDIVVNSIPAQFINAPTLVQQGLATYIQNGTFVATSKGPISMGKLNFTANSQHSMWLRGNTQESRTTGGYSAAVPEIAGSRGTTPTYSVAAGWTWNISPESLNELRATFMHQMVNTHANCLDVLGNYAGPGANPDGGGAPNGYWANITYGSANGVSIRCLASTVKGNVGTSELPLDDTITLIKGHHVVKLGLGLHYYGLLTPPQHRNRDDPTIGMLGTVPFTYNLATASVSSLPQSDLLKYQNLLSPVNISAYSYGSFAEDNFQALPDLTLHLGIRYDVDRGATGLNKIVPPGQPLLRNIYDEISPRFGFAWSPFKDKGTVFRGGVGIYYDKTTFNIYGAYRSVATATSSFDLNASRPTGNPYCFSNTLCSSGTVPTPQQQYVEFEIAKAMVNFALPHFPQPGDPNDVITIGSTTLSIPAPTFIGPSGTVLPSPTGSSSSLPSDFKNGGTFQYSFGISTTLRTNITASVDFVYNRGFDQYLIMETNVNPYTQAPPINPNFTSILRWTNLGRFTSPSLRTRITYRAQRGEVQLAYTLARAYDNTTNGFSAGTSTASTNPLDPMYDWGPSGSDIRHNLYASGTYRAPFGIQASPILQIASALPYTATTNATSVPGCAPYFTQCYPVGYFKNSLRGQSTILLNGRLAKTVRLGEKRSVTALAEGFNLPNRANFGTNYGKNVTAANFKKPTGAGSMRQLQLGLHIDF
jgi:hypothetical protein